MVGRLLLSRAEPGFTLPAFERLAPPPAGELVEARIEANSAPGDIVADLFGRGGWVARAAIDRQRRAFSLESSPLTRLLAEVVLRPPDLRHLDAAFQSLSASPYGESSLRLAIADMFGDEMRDVRPEPRRSTRRSGAATRSSADPLPLHALPRPAEPCRSTRRSSPARRIASGPRATSVAADARNGCASGSRCRRAASSWSRPSSGCTRTGSSSGLAAILDRIEGDLRAAPVESALRLAFLHAVLPASRLGARWPAIPSLSIAGGAIRGADPGYVARAQPVARLRGRLPQGPRLRPAPRERRAGAARGALRGRPRSLVEGSPNAVVRVMTPSAWPSSRRPAAQSRARRSGRDPAGARPAARRGSARSGSRRRTTARRGRSGGRPPRCCHWSRCSGPRSARRGRGRRRRSGGPSRRSRRISPATARVILLLEHGGPEALVAAVLGGVGAGYRLVEARLAEAGRGCRRHRRAVPPGGILPAAARARRGNVQIEPGPGGRGDPDLVPGPGLFAPPERIEARPFSAREAAITVAGDGGRGAQGARRAGALRAAARRDPRRAGSERPAATARRRGAGDESERRFGSPAAPEPGDAPPDGPDGRLRRGPGHARCGGAGTGGGAGSAAPRRSAPGRSRKRPSRATRSSGCSP